ncbi:hypothetical protein SteCoe_31848 [Stentor coeruleus]|uniref:Uncharacterized protein n=1 Tax=Stentor coeruleus TaxID=5963 RepID=A0A1R2B0D5_9CILI|nr:hypothetical protein SteCoe_31848 [Stentor coeruleus]
MATSTTCAVLGCEGVGKSSFISRYLYNYLPSKYVPTKHPKTSTYTFTFPPPSIQLTIIESIELPEDPISSAILLYDPLQPMTLDYVEKMIIQIQDKYPRNIGLVIAAVVRGTTKTGRGRTIATKYNANFILADMNSRNSIKRCFAVSIQWGKKNLAWESRKPLLYLREKTRQHLRS